MRVILILCSLLSLIACGQKTEKPYKINNYIFPEAKDVTASNYVQKITSNIKHYDKEPIYYMRITKNNCLIDVFLNDVYTHDDFSTSNYITPIKVKNMLKSGPQVITIKMYPVGNLINEELGEANKPPITELLDSSEVSIEMVRIDEKSKKYFADEVSVVTKVSPKGSIVAGKKEYEFSFTFNAEVPYEFEGWTKGQNIEKLDQKLVLRKALEFYKMCGEIHVNKDLDSWLKLKYPSSLRLNSALYSGQEKMKSILDGYKEDVLNGNFEMKPFEGYEIVYRGGGKLLTLIKTDPYYKRSCALVLKDKKADWGITPDITLYLPEGRDLEKQGFMMWK